MFRPPKPAESAAPARWLQDRITDSDPNFVTSTAGSGFDAYARIFHPLGDEPDALRWRDVAAANRRVLHPSAQWEHISRPPGSVIPSDLSGREYPDEPTPGELAPVFLEPLCDLLADHTGTDRCWFGIWDGWGWLNGSLAVIQSVSTSGDATAPPPSATVPSRERLDLRAPRADFPLGRTYLLYEGVVHDALRFGHWVTDLWFDRQSPSLFWPEDHSWSVATEIDFDSTILGGPRALITEIVASPFIEALAIAADAPYQDRVNP